MRQASWEELFKQGDEKPVEEKPWSRLAIFSWEELVTLVIVLIAFFTVVQSVTNADWVPEMPSLYFISFFGLAVGLALSRTRIHEAFVHLIALAVGVVAVIYVSTSRLEGSLPDRVSDLASRMKLWSDALFGGGISTDNLPFVLLVVSVTYLGSYLAAWSIFRWYNAWLALLPGGLALLTNISYLPGQKSFSLLVYLFCAILLVARVNLLRHTRDWRRTNTRYPDLISLHVLNVTVWVALALLAMAWVLPVGSGNGALFNLWSKVTSPVTAPFGDFSRVFSAIDGKKGGSFHHFGATLPLQGSISLGGGEVMVVNTTEPAYLRAQSYDVYTAQGWKIGSNSQITTSAWPAKKLLQALEQAQRQQRRNSTIQVTTSRDMGVIVSAGDPVSVSIDSRVVFGPDQADVTSVRPTKRLDDGDQYRVDSTVTNASVGRLRNAPATYPAWTNAYTQLPNNLPAGIRNKAREVTAGYTNAFDQADAIEKYLRTFAVDTKIDAAPANRDSVDYFLFTLGRGYFDYHASAMVVMLRTLGIPSRMAVGYTVRVQDRIPDSNLYVVTDANSFAWPEVYFPGLGWIEFNPTPSEPRINRSGQEDPSLANPTEDLPLDVLPEDLFPVEETGDAAPILDALSEDQGSSLISRILTIGVLAILAITVIGGGIFQYAWQRGMSGLDYPAQVWEKTLRLARWSRIRPPPQETPREVVARLKQALPDVEGLDYMGETYIRSRYGHKELAPAEKERLTTIWKQVRNTLAGRLTRWR